MQAKAETDSEVAIAPAETCPVLSPWMTLLFSLTCALAVANVYAAQPLLESMAASLNVAPGLIGSATAAIFAVYRAT